MILMCFFPLSKKDCKTVFAEAFKTILQNIFVRIFNNSFYAEIYLKYCKAIDLIYIQYRTNFLNLKFVRNARKAGDR